MAKRNRLHPYMRPLVPGFGKSFLNQTQVILPFIKKSCLRDVVFREDDHWIFIEGGGHRRKRTDTWMPKIYVCVGAKDYWDTVADILLLSRKLEFSWKFNKNIKFFSRPDKIIIYAKNPRKLKQILQVLRPRLKGKQFHDLSFVEKKGKGIFVGADPVFLKKQGSWRYYRWYVGEALIKPNLKRGSLEKNIGHLLSAMNISLKHNGPLSLNPPKKNIRFIKKIWKKIHPFS